MIQKEGQIIRIGKRSLPAVARIEERDKSNWFKCNPQKVDIDFLMMAIEGIEAKGQKAAVAYLSQAKEVLAIRFDDNRRRRYIFKVEMIASGVYSEDEFLALATRYFSPESANLAEFNMQELHGDDVNLAGL